MDPDHPLYAFATDLATLMDSAGGSKIICTKHELISRTTYYEWQGGRQVPSPDALEEVAKFCGADARHWLGRRRAVLQSMALQSHGSANGEDDDPDFWDTPFEVVIGRRFPPSEGFQAIEAEFLTHLNALRLSIEAPVNTFALAARSLNSTGLSLDAIEIETILDGTLTGEKRFIYQRRIALIELISTYPLKDGDMPAAAAVTLCKKYAELSLARAEMEPGGNHWANP
ncbi:hypothetical protein [Streptomyces sp. NPDC007172]|uniref:hypothetical protein n=1 Tax=Streptomyces sp. NPDC007172 TaxID=3364776 RepID=UPI0036C013FD